MGVFMASSGTLTGNFPFFFLDVINSISSSFGCFSLCPCFQKLSPLPSDDPLGKNLNSLHANSLPRSIKILRCPLLQQQVTQCNQPFFTLLAKVLRWKPNTQAPVHYIPLHVDNTDQALYISLWSPNWGKGKQLPSFRIREFTAQCSLKKSFSSILFLSHNKSFIPL